MKTGDEVQSPSRRAHLRPTRSLPEARGWSPDNAERRAAIRKDLANIWLLQGVPRSALEPLEVASQWRHYTAGETLFRQGDEADGLFFVVAGSVRIFAEAKNGSRLLAGVGPGECFGEMGVIDGETRSATAVTASLATLCFVPTEPFLDLLERAPLVSMKLLALLCRRLRQTNRFAAELSGNMLQVSDGDET